jgi:hypothetical protein
MESHCGSPFEIKLKRPVMHLAWANFKNYARHIILSSVSKIANAYI